MNPLISQLMQALAFQGGRRTPNPDDPLAFLTTITQNDLFNPDRDVMPDGQQWNAGSLQGTPFDDVQRALEGQPSFRVMDGPDRSTVVSPIQRAMARQQAIGQFSVPPESFPSGQSHMGDKLLAERLKANQPRPPLTYDNGRYVEGPNGGLVKAAPLGTEARTLSAITSLENGRNQTSPEVERLASIAEQMNAINADNAMANSPAERSIQQSLANVRANEGFLAAEKQSREKMIRRNEQGREGREASNIPAGLEKQIKAAMAGKSVQPSREQAAYEFATARPAGGSSLEAALTKAVSQLPEGARIDQMYPESRGKSTGVKGASGQTNQLVRTADGKSVLMSPRAYTAYKEALAGGDEKLALRAAQSASGEQQARDLKPRRQDELVRMKGLSALAALPALAEGADMGRMNGIAASRAARLGEAAANVQARQDQADPLMAMLRNNGSDSPIAQQLLLQRMGLSPRDAAAAAADSAKANAFTRSAEEDRKVKREEIGIQQQIAADNRTAKADDTRERSKAAQQNQDRQAIDDEVDPVRRAQLKQSYDKKYGVASVDGGGDTKESPVDRWSRLTAVLGDRAEPLLGQFESPNSPEKIAAAVAAETTSDTPLSPEEMKVLEEAYGRAPGRKAGTAKFGKAVSEKLVERARSEAIRKALSGYAGGTALLGPLFPGVGGLLGSGYNARDVGADALMNALRGVPEYFFGK